MRQAPARALRILIVDDEAELRSSLQQVFEREGHQVTAVGDARSGVQETLSGRFDIVLLDVALGPGPDGNDVCRALRARGVLTPIIMLTARTSEADAVVGLESGADDYVTKPFGVSELRSRIRAVLRRVDGHRPQRPSVSIGGVHLDREQRLVTKGGEPVHVTFSEFELLSALMEQPGRLLSREELLEAIWGDSAYRDPRGIDVHVRHLREKLEDEPEHPTFLLTVRGAGYRVNG